MIVSSGTITVVRYFDAAVLGEPSLTSGRTAKSSPATPTFGEQRAELVDLAGVQLGVSVIAARSGSPSSRAYAMPSIVFCHEPAPRQASWVSARAPSTDV